MNVGSFQFFFCALFELSISVSGQLTKNVFPISKFPFWLLYDCWFFCQMRLVTSEFASCKAKSLRSKMADKCGNLKNFLVFELENWENK